MRTIDPFAPVELGKLPLRNRFIKAATFEGMAPEGFVTERLIDFHRSMAAGGVGLTTVAYLAVSGDGRGAPAEIVVRPETLPGLRRLAEAVHAEGAAVSGQLGHAGPVAAARARRALGPSRVLRPVPIPFVVSADEHELERILGDFAESARLLRDAGFDAIELHLGHNYLLSAFLSPALNRRRDRWGGGLGNRAAYPRKVVNAVRAAVGDAMTVTAKLNMTDGYPGGLWLDESLEFAKMLESDGALDALELTGGSSLRNPMYLFRGEAPVAEMARAFPQPIKAGFRVLGKRFLPSYPFEEAYFLSYARQFRVAVNLPLILLGGINRIETVHSALAEGFDFLALGRALLREPGLVERWRTGDASEALCVHCNKCMATIYDGGTHCVLLPPEQRPGRA